MNIIISENYYINKRVLIIALVLGLFLNLGLLGLFEYYISKVPPLEPPKEPVIKYVEIKKPKPKKKRIIKKVKRKKVVKKKTFKTKKKVYAKKATSPKTSKKEVLPAATVPLPKVENLEEKEIALPEKEVDVGLNVDIPLKSKDLGELKTVSFGVFSPKFGQKLSKFDSTAFGTATERYLVYKPDPPRIKTKRPPPSVKVKIWVNPDGTVGRVEPITTTNDKKIDSIIWNYVKKWKFNEIHSNEKQWAVVTIRFRPES
ncbi:MAG: energy transducer TonB [Aquificae bacterium]|nr:energy transducer TonB [Aquificota bacterium]